MKIHNTRSRVRGGSLFTLLPFYLLTFPFCLLALLPLATSCTHDEDDLFPESAAQRINNSVSYYQNLLKSSDNGWAIEYIPGTGDYGGFVYTAKFTDQDVTIAADVSAQSGSQSWPAGKEVTSLYSVKAEQGIILSFDTYNPPFHGWSQPLSSSYPDGYGGDYEFIFNEISENSDTIRFTGKKHGNKMVMYKIKDMSARDFMQRIIYIRDVLNTLNYSSINVGGKNYPLSLGRWLAITDTLDADTTVMEPILITATGFHTYETMKIAGHKLNNFTLDENKGIFVDNAKVARLEIPSIKDQIERPKGYGIDTPKSPYEWTFLQSEMDEEDQKTYDYFLHYSGMWGDLEPWEGMRLGPNMWGKSYYDESGLTYTSQVIGLQYGDAYMGGHKPFYYGIEYSYNQNNGTLAISYVGEGFGLSSYKTWKDRNVYPYIMRIINNSPYKVTLNDGLVKTHMRLVSVDNPSVFFGLKLDNSIDSYL